MCILTSCYLLNLTACVTSVNHVCDSYLMTSAYIMYLHYVHTSGMIHTQVNGKYHSCYHVLCPTYAYVMVYDLGFNCGAYCLHFILFHHPYQPELMKSIIMCHGFGTGIEFWSLSCTKRKLLALRICFRRGISIISALAFL